MFSIYFVFTILMGAIAYTAILSENKGCSLFLHQWFAVIASALLWPLTTALIIYDLTKNYFSENGE